MVFHVYYYLGNKSVASKRRRSVWVQQKKPVPSVEKALRPASPIHCLANNDLADAHSFLRPKYPSFEGGRLAFSYL